VLSIGTSGWQYRDWKPGFYDAKLPQRLWLERYAEAFATVEINNAFYRLPEKATFEAWRERTPDDFCFAVKMSRYLTHIKRLRDPEEPVARFLERAAGLGDKLGPVLLQLPPTLRADPAALAATLRLFPRSVRVAVEPRHPSWWIDPVRDVLGEHGAALVWADRRGRPQGPLWVTAGWCYLRFHEGRANPWPRYGVRALDSWLERIPSRATAWAYFNNDQHGAATADASALARRARRPTTRTP
jgi:uncharacterized protein YecE (DUF72 family)